MERLDLRPSGALHGGGNFAAAAGVVLRVDALGVAGGEAFPKIGDEDGVDCCLALRLNLCSVTLGSDDGVDCCLALRVALCSGVSDGGAAGVVEGEAISALEDGAYSTLEKDFGLACFWLVLSEQTAFGRGGRISLEDFAFVAGDGGWDSDFGGGGGGIVGFRL